MLHETERSAVNLVFRHHQGSLNTIKSKSEHGRLNSEAGGSDNLPPDCQQIPKPSKPTDPGGKPVLFIFLVHFAHAVGKW